MEDQMTRQDLDEEPCDYCGHDAQYCTCGADEDE